MSVIIEPEQTQPEPEVWVYKLPKSYLVLGLFGLIFFTLATVGGVALPLVNPDGSFTRPVEFAIVAGLVFGGFTLLSIYMLVAYRRERLYVSSAGIRAVGVFRSRAALFAEVARAVWRSWPRGGSIVLHTAEGRLAIDFANYEGGKELAPFLRATLPTDVQSNYERYESTNVRASVAFQQLRERNNRTAAWMLPVCGLALIALAVWDP
jgi:hypothetical protein